MQFHEMLNDYLRRLNVTALELAAASELSPAVISRYRSAERTPAPDSEALTRLAKGIASLAGQKGDAALSQESVLRTLRKALGYEEYGQAGWRQISTCSSTCSTFALAKWRGH